MSSLLRYGSTMQWWKTWEVQLGPKGESVVASGAAVDDMAEEVLRTSIGVGGCDERCGPSEEWNG